MSELLKTIERFKVAHRDVIDTEQAMEKAEATYTKCCEQIKRLLRDNPSYHEYIEAVQQSMQIFQGIDFSKTTEDKTIQMATPYLDLTEILRQPKELKEQLLKDPAVDENIKSWLYPSRQFLTKISG